MLSLLEAVLLPMEQHLKRIALLMERIQTQTLLLFLTLNTLANQTSGQLLLIAKLLWETTLSLRTAKDADP